MKSGYVKQTPIKVTTTGSSKVLSSNNAIVSHKSSSSGSSSSSSSSSKSSGSTDPVTNPTAPTVANLPNNSNSSEATPSNSVTTGVPSSPDGGSQFQVNKDITPQSINEGEGFGGGGSGARGSLGDTSQGYFALSTGERFDTLGESLNADWQYYKPVAHLALFEAGAAEAVLSKASSLVGKITSKYFPKGVSKSINWAEGEIVRTGMPSITSKAGKITPAVNSKTLFGLNKNLVKAGFGVGTAAYIIKEGASSKTFSEFQIVEGMDKLGYVRTAAMEQGDIDSVAEIDSMMSDLQNQSFWQEAGSYMPWFGGNVGTQQNIKSATTANNVWKKISEYKASGESDDDMWTRVRVEQAESEKAAIDYYNDQRKQMLQWERESARMQRNEDATFWAKQRAEQDKLELQQAETIAEFWNEYRKKVAEYNASQASSYEPQYSKLNFGII